MTALLPDLPSVRVRLGRVPLSLLGTARVLVPVAAVLTLTLTGQVVALTALLSGVTTTADVTAPLIALGTAAAVVVLIILQFTARSAGRSWKTRLLAAGMPQAGQAQAVEERLHTLARFTPLTLLLLGVSVPLDGQPLLSASLSVTATALMVLGTLHALALLLPDQKSTP